VGSSERGEEALWMKRRTQPFIHSSLVGKLNNLEGWEVGGGGEIKKD